MNETVQRGYWWTPNDVKNGVPGTLTFSKQDGLLLQTLGALHHKRRRRGADEVLITRCPLILGMTEEGEEITLESCTLGSRKERFPGIRSDQWKPSCGYAGAHFDKAGDLRFNRAIVEYSHAWDWGPSARFEHERSMGVDDRWAEYRFAYTRSASVSAEAGGVTITVAHVLDHTGDLWKEAAFRQRTVFEFETEHDLTMPEWGEQFVSPIQNLLTLATTEPNYPQSIVLDYRLRSDQTEEERARQNRVEFLFGDRLAAAASHQRPHRSQMLFSLDEIRPRFVDVLNRWLRVSRELDTVADLFFVVQYYGEEYLINQFLNLAQAVEVYHRQTRPDELLPLSRAEFRKRKRTLLKNIPEADQAEWKQWLDRALQHANQATLVQRVKALLDWAAPAMLPLVGDTTAFAEWVRDTRNHYTHYGDESGGKVAREVSLFRMTQTLSFLLKSCFLQELGWEPEDAARRMRRDPRYRFFAERVGPLKRI